MATKRILFRFEARERVLRGAIGLGDAVRITLGPESRSVLIQHHWGMPMVCDDAVTIATDFHLADHDDEVVRIVLENALSVADMRQLTEATSIELPTPEGEQADLPGEP